VTFISQRVPGTKATVVLADSTAWLKEQPRKSISAVVTDPPYGLVEFSDGNLAKLRTGHGGNWRIPPNIGGVKRAPLPRFTTLTAKELEEIRAYFQRFGELLLPVLKPGAHVFVASNPLVAHLVTAGLTASGLENRGTIIRLVKTMRGGDRPKGAEEEFTDCSVMPRSQWEPWVLVRRPLEGTVAENLRSYGVGALRRISDDQPFGDVIQCAPTNRRERELAPHPNLKPQRFLRQIVKAALPYGGTLIDPFCGSGSALAAAEFCGFESVGVERDPMFYELANTSIPALAAYDTRLT
jgi:DNA modification methylase